MSEIQKAKDAKQDLISEIRNYAKFEPLVSIVFDKENGNKLALKIVFKKRTGQGWNTNYRGFRLIVEEPRV